LIFSTSNSFFQPTLTSLRGDAAVSVDRQLVPHWPALELINARSLRLRTTDPAVLPVPYPKRGVLESSLCSSLVPGGTGALNRRLLRQPFSARKLDFIRILRRVFAMLCEPALRYPSPDLSTPTIPWLQSNCSSRAGRKLVKFSTSQPSPSCPTPTFSSLLPQLARFHLRGLRIVSSDPHRGTETSPDADAEKESAGTTGPDILGMIFSLVVNHLFFALPPSRALRLHLRTLRAVDVQALRGG